MTKMMTMMHKKKTINNLKIEALNQNIPILSDDGLFFLIETIKNEKAKRVLEIGSAIGYSAIAIALMTDCHVYTIEKDKSRYEQALIHIKAFELEDKITIVNDDALTHIIKDHEPFDCIFIDAGKAQYKKFFNLYQNF